MFGWFRFREEITTGHRIFSFGNSSAEHYFVTLTKSGSLFQFKLYLKQAGVESLIATNQINASSSLIFIGLRLFKGGINQTSYIFTVGETCSTGNISTTNYVSNLTKFVLGNRNITTGSTIPNPFKEDIALISLGAYPYTNEIFQTIQAQENRFQTMIVKPKTGVSFVNQKTYENFEVMSLNGTFKSSSGRIPTDYEFIDGTFKLDKTKLFKYDELLERHVYGSYSAAQGFGLVKGLLAYQHDLTNYGVVAINFKMEGTTTNNRTIFDFRSDITSKLKVYRSTAGYISLVVNGTTHYTNIAVPLNQWNRILVTFAYQGTSSQIHVHLNDYANSSTITAEVDVTNTKLVIGSSLLIDSTPSEHLDGVLEMLAFQKNYWGGNTIGINRIVKGEQQLSVKTEIDIMGRSYKDIIDTGIPETNLQTTKKLVSQYAYTEPGVDELGVTKTSLQVSGVQGFDGFNKEYSYDSMGNITKIKVIYAEDTNVFHEFEYVYDKLSRLKEEYNPKINQTMVYEYGLNNNISSVTHYQGKKDVLIKTETYVYNDTYEDQLDSISTDESGVITTKTIGYNSNRVPTSFLGKTLGWQGRRLTSINGTNIKYQYNDAGIRTSKEVNGVTTDYYLIGDKVGSLCKGGSSKLFFHYNERNMLVGFEYDKENYLYSRDLTGNITSIVDKNGSIMVEYQYDAWGKWLNRATAAKTSVGSTILLLNPFLYKGYIYDEESGFYYLKSRYYSPEVRRFISVDSEVGDVGKLENHNLFTYCNNNPVMLADENGNWPKWLTVVIVAAVIVIAIAVVTAASGGLAGPVIIGALIGAGVGGTASAATQLITTGEINWDQVFVDAAIGAVMGAFGGSAIGRLGMTFAGGFTGAGGEFASQLVSGGPLNIGAIIGAGATGALFGFISGPGAQHGKLTNRQKIKIRQKDKGNKARHIKNLDKQLDKYTTRLYRSAMKDIKGSIVWDVISSMIDSLI